MHNSPSLVFVVDDDPGMRRGISSLLRSEGFDTAEFPSALAALSDQALDRADCLLTDLQMPGMDGIELVRAIANVHPRLPVILMTAFGDETTRQRAMATGARAFLIKPFETDQLLREIGLALHLERG